MKLLNHKHITTHNHISYAEHLQSIVRATRSLRAQHKAIAKERIARSKPAPKEFTFTCKNGKPKLTMRLRKPGYLTVSEFNQITATHSLDADTLKAYLIKRKIELRNV